MHISVHMMNTVSSSSVLYLVGLWQNRTILLTIHAALCLGLREVFHFSSSLRLNYDMATPLKQLFAGNSIFPGSRYESLMHFVVNDLICSSGQVKQCSNSHSHSKSHFVANDLNYITHLHPCHPSLNFNGDMKMFIRANCAYQSLCPNSGSR